MIVNITLKREIFTDSYTAGTMYIEGKRFGRTLERRNRDLNHKNGFDNGEKKVYGDTCIPFGRYKLTVSYSPKFRRELILVNNVPEFSGIRIHRGNYPKDSIGCILVAERFVNGRLYNSTPYETWITNYVKNEIKRGNEIWLTIS